MNALLLLRGFLATGLVNVADLEEIEWKAFKVAHNKTYPSVAEEQFRKTIFLESKLKVAEHNGLFEKGEVLFSLELNKYADLTWQEFAGRHNGMKNVLSARPDIRPQGYRRPLNNLPEKWDWRDLGAVTPVKDQGSCASCWAFAATGSLESRYYLKTGQLVQFSEQSLVDCSDQNDGCHGGLVPLAYKYIAMKGIARAVDYPYIGKKGQCRLNPSMNITRLRGWAQVDDREKALQEAVVLKGPLAAGMHGSLDTFQLYKSGIYYEPRCSSKKLNHDVLVVGYGSEDGQDYWLVKNSFGVKWGEQGYMRLLRNSGYSGGHCGIATFAFYPTFSSSRFSTLNREISLRSATV